MKHGEKLGDLLETKETELISEGGIKKTLMHSRESSKGKGQACYYMLSSQFLYVSDLHMLDRAESAVSQEAQLKYIAGRVG